jgi:hypothetical protein
MAQLVTTGPVMTPLGHEVDHRLRDYVRVDRQLAPIGQVSQHLVRHAAKADLKRGAVGDEPGDVAGDLLGHFAGRVMEVLDHGGLDPYEMGDAVERNPAVAGPARHRGVHLGDHGARGQGCGLGHVDRYPQAAGAVRIRRRDLNQRDVERDLPVLEELGDVGERERQVLHSTRLAQLADIAPHVEDAVAIVGAGRITGADTVGEEMREDRPGPAESLQRLHEASRSGARAADEDPVAGGDNRHCLCGRHLAVAPVERRVDAHAASVARLVRARPTDKTTDQRARQSTARQPITWRRRACGGAAASPRPRRACDSRS